MMSGQVSGFTDLRRPNLRNAKNRFAIRNNIASAMALNLTGWDCSEHVLACSSSSLRSDHSPVLSTGSCPKSAVADFVEHGFFILSRARQ